MSAENLPVAPIPYDGVRAPDFPAGFLWFNTKPLSLRGLRGKVVLLDFWTYGCINCQHILPDLKRLEAKYRNELVVISVHSAKFDAESKAQAVKNAVLRLKIEHPVLVDQKMRVWSEYAVKAWPTLVLIDPAGRVAGQVAGEGNFDRLDATISQLISKAKKRGEMSGTPLKFALERAKVKPSPLSFPGKVLANHGTLYVADSGHNRIIQTNINGEVFAIAGSGAPGFKDGSLQTARFNNPQGMAYDPSFNVLYVADTGNHAIRAIRFSDKTVSTIAGDGKQAAWGATGGTGKKARLSSPWDVTYAGSTETLYIAMAGTHQIWKMDLMNDKVSVLAGSGAEGRRDGTLKNAAFAQTSGLEWTGDKLYAADAESSCIRVIDLEEKTVKTIAGGDLFDFGDRDGRGDAVRLQHPLGITSSGEFLYLADTYNSKIKRLNPRTGAVSSFFAGGLNEPGGLCLDEGALYIADTNNGVIKRLDVAKKTIQTVRLVGLKAPRPSAPAPKIEVPARLTSTRQILAPDSAGTLIFEAKMPAGFHLNRAAPLKFSAQVEGQGVTLGQSAVSGAKFTLPLRISLQTAKEGRGAVEISAFISYCNEGTGAVCKVESVERRVEFEIKEGGAKEIKIAVSLP